MFAGTEVILNVKEGAHEPDNPHPCGASQSVDYAVQDGQQLRDTAVAFFVGPHVEKTQSPPNGKC